MPSLSEERDCVLLWEIERALRNVELFVGDLDQEAFVASDKDVAAVGMMLLAIGEAANKLSESARSELPHVPWRKIIDLRNLLAHGYWQAERYELWIVAVEHAPRLLEAIAPLLASQGRGL